MSNLSRDAILKEMLSVLLRGWGKTNVYEALAELTDVRRSNATVDKAKAQKPKVNHNALRLVHELGLKGEREALMLNLAEQYEQGVAFPKLSDVKSFLASHNRGTTDVRSREQAFRNILPILQRMSEKGLLKLLSRAGHSGPADLGSISEAIKGAGQDLRGGKTNDTEK